MANEDHKWKNSHIFSNYYTEKKPLIINGEEWLNTEQFFQAEKYNRFGKTNPSLGRPVKREQEYREFIRIADSSQKTKMLANQKPDLRFGKKWRLNTGKTWKPNGKNSKDDRIVNDLIYEYKDKVVFDKEWWDSRSIYVMITALTHKFTQYKNLYNIIVNEIEDNDYLVENTSRDKIWADGGDKGSGKIGKNYLGKILTVLHHILKYGDCSHMSNDLRKKVKIYK